jgi:hypothetical protein
MVPDGRYLEALLTMEAGEIHLGGFQGMLPPVRVESVNSGLTVVVCSTSRPE